MSHPGLQWAARAALVATAAVAFTAVSGAVATAHEVVIKLHCTTDTNQAVVKDLGPVPS